MGQGMLEPMGIKSLASFDMSKLVAAASAQGSTIMILGGDGTAVQVRFFFAMRAGAMRSLLGELRIVGPASLVWPHMQALFHFAPSSLPRTLRQCLCCEMWGPADGLGRASKPCSTPRGEPLLILLFSLSLVHSRHAAINACGRFPGVTPGVEPGRRQQLAHHVRGGQGG